MIWLERQRFFLDFTLSSLWRRKGRNLSLLVVYSLVTFLLSSVIFFTHALRKEAVIILKDGPEMIVQRTVGGRHSLIPVSYIEKIKLIRGVSSVNPRLWGYYFHPASRTNYTIMVPENFSQPDDTVETGAGVLRTWGPLTDGKLYIRAHDGEAIVLKPINTMGEGTDLVSSDLILMSETIFRKISGVPAGYATDLSVTIRNQRESATISTKITRDLPDTRPILKEDIIRTYSSLFDWRGGYVIVLLCGTVLAFFIFAWDRATGLSAEEKKEIGILKGIGWDTSDVLMMKFWEGVVISVSAFLLGVITAYIHIYVTSATLFQHALKGWSTLYPNFSLSPAIDPYQLAILFFLTVVPYTLLTIVPTWTVAVSDPDQVMRH
ncbi:MAG: ABC transporter permease [Proteobacteria bacterium]|nr:ABC transporter permease [Pseudomonadota bacterium]MBU1420181.1 ABC transporter permease [Pseudomonadota bacterium]MBU1455213.1 ABC transporter permease [Pseudomonadota bacterium]